MFSEEMIDVVANHNSRTPNAMSNSTQYGWFDNIEDFQLPALLAKDDSLKRVLSLPTPVSKPPLYVLESSVDSQLLWYVTAGCRPPQPPEERHEIEEIWKENLSKSEAIGVRRSDNEKYEEDKAVAQREFSETVLFRGRGPFSNAVSKYFVDHQISMTVQIPVFKIVKTIQGEIIAKFLVVVSYGSILLGVWKRHSDFKELFTKIQALHGKDDHDYQNAIMSWNCVLSKQRWFRCLDKDYLVLKCFLLERFMQDLLFESPAPDLMNCFVDAK